MAPAEPAFEARRKLMMHTATYSAFVPHRRTRTLFLLRTAQHVRSMSVGRELLRALLALAGAVSWAAVLLLIGGA
jgi:hypothetical protein